MSSPTRGSPLAEHRAAREERAVVKMRALVHNARDDPTDMLEAFGGERACLLRFLRARKMDAQLAHEAFSNTRAFRAAWGVGLGSLAAARAEGVADWWCGTFAGRAKNGAIVTYWRIQCSEANKLKESFSEDQLGRFYVAWMERSLQLQRELPDCPGSLDIYDLEVGDRSRLGVGWLQAADCGSHWACGLPLFLGPFRALRSAS